MCSIFLDHYIMRLVNVEQLKGGEILGQDILTPEGSVLLRASSRFKLAYKKYLTQRYIYEIYIDDEVSKGIIPNPVIPPHIKQSLTRHLEHQFKEVEKFTTVNLEQMKCLTSTIINELSNKNVIFDVLDLQHNDKYTYSHCINVSILSCALAKKLGFNYEDINHIVTGALLHDLGKIILPKDILNKPGQLTASERNIIKTHCQIGYDIIKNDLSLNAISKVIILCHHEREDGNGYPLNKGADLHLGAKLVAVADVFDALVANRPYRLGFAPSYALKILKDQKLNQDIINILENMIAYYPIGSTVKLSNNLIALVEQNFPNNPNRPLVRVIYNETNNTILNYNLDLRNEANIHILENSNLFSLDKLRA